MEANIRGMTEPTPLKSGESQMLAGRAQPLRRELEQSRQERNAAMAQLLELQLDSEARVTALRGRIQQLEELSAGEQAQHSATLEALRGAVAERDQQMARLRDGLAERDRQIENLHQTLAELDHRRRAIDQQLAESNDRIVSLCHAVDDRDRMVAERDEAVRDRETHIARLYASTSWRATAPMRYLKRRWLVFGRRLRSLGGTWLRAIYLALPLPWSLKRTVKGIVFALLSPFLQTTGAYRAWIAFEHGRAQRAQTRRGWRRLRPVLAEWARALYLVAPLPMAVKMWVKGLLFALLSPLFRNTRAYRDWMEFERAKRQGLHAAATAEPYPAQASVRNGGAIESDPPPAIVVDVPLRPVAPDRAEERAGPAEMQAAGSEAVAEPSAPTATTGEPLRNADGHYEWEDYLPTRMRILEVERARRDAFSPEAPTLIDIGQDDPAAAVDRIRLPASGARPEVSIIIPVYNQAKYTIECLLSIAACTDAHTTFEVIVADDGSTDETASLLSRAPHLRLIKGKRNVGFLRNCNNAAAHARGEFLLFLNNDTQVTEGWLTALVKTVRETEHCAAAGPKLIYPSGHLQEAGATMRQDCTTEMVGLNDDPGLHRYNYARDVDYCSGACLLINAALFRELGGFDEAYAPAYCEDADLCLRTRKAGYRVLYCPDAVVIHHLSKTSDDLQDDYKLGCVAANLQTVSRRWQTELDQNDDPRLIAFYLPQFHPIPENDVWWGKGFTEWMNVTRAKPNFVGHYQPHLPADLGYYDLRVPEVMDHQARLAQRYGIHGFCFYYYWFAGRRVLELPLERLLETERPDIPFCLCWANENWTRRWDGMDHEILVAQQHSEADDLAVIKDLCRFFSKPRYIRVNGKPLILVYRVTLFPDFAATAAVWRQYCRDAGIGDIYIAMVESFELVHVDTPPSRFGCDAAVEFPPLGMGEPKPPHGEILNERFTGYIADYRDVAVRYATRPYPPYKRFLGVMPGWDNTPRRQDNGFIFDRSSPGTFQAWMEQTFQTTRAQLVGDERLVFLNAWNEWAEGAHLEPDQRFGHTYLEAVANAKQASGLLRRDRYALGG